MSNHRGLSATKVLGALLLLSVPARLKAQVLVAPSDIPQVSKILDSSRKGGALQCQFKISDPFLDYDLRYEIAFSVSRSTEQLRPGDQETAYLGVTPQGGSPVYLTQTFEVAPDANRGKIPQLTATVGGGFNVGEGRYAVDLALMDQPGAPPFLPLILRVPHAGSMSVGLFPTPAPLLCAQAFSGLVTFFQATARLIAPRNSDGTFPDILFKRTICSQLKPTTPQTGQTARSSGRSALQCRHKGIGAKRPTARAASPAQAFPHRRPPPETTRSADAHHCAGRLSTPGSSPSRSL